MAIDDDAIKYFKKEQSVRVHDDPNFQYLGLATTAIEFMRDHVCKAGNDEMFVAHLKAEIERLNKNRRAYPSDGFIEDRAAERTLDNLLTELLNGSLYRYRPPRSLVP